MSDRSALPTLAVQASRLHGGDAGETPAPQGIECAIGRRTDFLIRPDSRDGLRKSVLRR